MRKVKFYIGFDPTADCLHVGHFMQVIIMMYMQKFGHTPVVLLGGGTGMVGDPSGTDRYASDDDCWRRSRAIVKPVQEAVSISFLDFDEDWKYVGQRMACLNRATRTREPEPGKAIAVNNARWLLTAELH